MRENLSIHDPIHGFIQINNAFFLRIIEHRAMRRLRHIRQLGALDEVFPNATHTRFSHALGSMHVMKNVLKHLKKSLPTPYKNTLLLAALLHDIGHAPFSHSLEKEILPRTHEALTQRIIKEILVEIARNEEEKNTLIAAAHLLDNHGTKNHEVPYEVPHELLSGALDVDRLDYLQRDSFYTGVAEGHINYQRLLELLLVKNQALYIMAKGRHSLESFFHARKMMYIHAYEHKCSLALDHMLKKVLQRAKKLLQEGVHIGGSSPLCALLKQSAHEEKKNLLGAKIKENTSLKTEKEGIDLFLQVNDHSLWHSFSVWETHPDPVLSYLSQSLLTRNIFGIRFQRKPFEDEEMNEIKEYGAKIGPFDASDIAYLIDKYPLRVRKKPPHTKSTKKQRRKRFCTFVRDSTTHMRKRSLAKVERGT